MRARLLFLCLAVLLPPVACRRAPVQDSPAPAETTPLSRIVGASAELQDIPFREVIAATTGHRVLKADPADPLLPLLGRVLDESLAAFNQPDSPLENLRRINEASRFFEDRIREGIDADPAYSCDVPRTTEGNSQRAGYPDLRIVHDASGRVFYLDPKLFESGSEASTLRTFYFEPKAATGKVMGDAVHLLVGIAHDGNDGAWKFLRWHLVDLHGFRVRLKAEFQAGNRELYRPELLLRQGPSAHEAVSP